MGDTKDRYALAKLIDDMVSDAILAGKSEALKCLGQFTPTEGVTVSVLHRSISQKRAQLIGYFDETATPPSDAALADDALCESLIEASDMRWNGDVYVGDGADLMNLVRAALRARAVPDCASALAVLSDAMEQDSDYAWTWHCNIAMTAQDAGATHDRANRWAADFMKRAFNVNTMPQVNALLAASKAAEGK